MKHYMPDMSIWSMHDYQKILEVKKLLPGRISLKVDMEKNFQKLIKCGIKDVAQLIESLKSKKHIQSVSEKTGISSEYLVLLIREARSNLPVIVKLEAFPQTDQKHIHKLQKMDLKNSRQYWEYWMNEKSSLERVFEGDTLARDRLFSLSDLIRMTGVGPIFAVMLYIAGVTSIKDYNNTNLESLYVTLVKNNEKDNLVAARFTVADLYYCKDFISLLL